MDKNKDNLQTPQEKMMMKICGLFSSMPYSGGIGFQFGGENMTLDMIAGNLEKLKETLQRAGARENEKDRELREFRDATAGVAFFFRKFREAEATCGEPAPKEFSFEIELRGFDGSTDATDNLIKWLRAPSIEAVRRFIKYNHLPVQQYHQMVNGFEPSTRAEGIDVYLNADGHMIRSGDIERVQRWTAESDEITSRGPKD